MLYHIASLFHDLQLFRVRCDLVTSDETFRQYREIYFSFAATDFWANSCTEDEADNVQRLRRRVL